MTIDELRAATHRERINAEILEMHYRAHKQAAEEYARRAWEAEHLKGE